jgi:hypothetical protein
MKQRILQVVTICVTLVASAALGKSTTVSVPVSQVGTYSGDRGQFYVVNLSLPAEIAGKQLDAVILEFAVDASALSLEDSVVSPRVGVFPLTQAYTAGVDAHAPGRATAPVYATNVSSTRPVGRGSNRTIKMDVTDIVKGWIASPSTNHGFVIGTLTGPDVGRVSLRGEALRATFLYENGFGEPVSERQ